MKHILKPLTTALRGKGPPTFVKRVGMIGRRYGLTEAKMDRSLQHMTQILQEYDCRATLPVTAVVLARHSPMVRKYQDQGVEFLVHGYAHVDYSQVAPEEELAHLQRACEIFSEAGITAKGFRSPYLRPDHHLNASLESLGFSYVSNQAIVWDVLDANAFTRLTNSSYQQAFRFYNPWLASERLALPQLRNKLVEIPVSLPDDEMLLDRLGDKTQKLVAKAWQRILSQTHHRGELFTIQLHPERIALCEDGFSHVLDEANTLTPSVWLARMDEVATWWRTRAVAEIDIKEETRNDWQLAVIGPPGTTILARRVEIFGPTKPWADDYQQVISLTCHVKATCRPFIGISPASPPTLTSFLRQQGYILQVSDDVKAYSIYLDCNHFSPEDELSLLTEIENGAGPLVRLGRWPNGARSALCVTGDLDAVTLWDYGLRLIGR